jgi:hypothetical protein
MNFPFAKMLPLAASLSLCQANKRGRIRRVVSCLRLCQPAAVVLLIAKNEKFGTFSF